MIDRDSNEEIVKAMVSHYGNSRLRLPSGIVFEHEVDNCYSMILDSMSVQKTNMQLDDNAFEGWAIAAYVAMNCSVKIVLDVFGTFEYRQYEKNGHLGRFFYRAYRFNEQYEWFSLSPYLKAETDKYMEYLLSTNKQLFNNIGNCEADVKEDHNKENLAEAKLAIPGIFRKHVRPNYDYGENELYRQFPVGLFKDKVSDATMLFTGKKSAIDLWTWRNDELCVVELKSKKKMVGIVTEIFFYTNYMRDLLLDDGIFTLNENNGKIDGNDRGYSKLKSLHINRISGMMLADVYHPLINDEAIDIMNAGKSDIKYMIAEYDFAKLISE